LAFDIGENHFEQKEINIVSPISKVAVHPERGKVVFLTRNGQMFSVLANEFSSQAVILEMNLKFSIKDFAVYWEKEISLFCSNGGQLTLYDLKSDSILLTFTAHCGKINDVCLLEQQLITLGEDKEMRSWDMKYLIEESQNAKSKADSKKIKETFIEQSDIVSLSPSYDGDELLTVHDDGTVKIWNLNSQKLLCQYSIGVAADTIHLFSNNLVSFLDTSVGRMKILDIKTGLEAFRISETIQGNILNSTTDKRDNLYIVSAQKTGKEQIDIFNIGRMMIVKTIHLQNGLSYKRLEAVLSVNERYLVLRVLMSERQFEQVRELYHQHFPWKKGGFTDQNHRYRFTAVALSEGSGALIHCYRIAAKVPTIGIHVKPYKGNVMLISTRR
jgi:WD40 repeat protein